MGGVRKEYFQLLVDRIFGPQSTLFRYNPQTRQSFFIPFADKKREGEYLTVGMLLGMAIFNNIFLDAHLPLAVYHVIVVIAHTFPPPICH